ncbi:SurA N-terminal domain-containing protein [Piscibacillus halophilus]|uniref:SurA N-terminal domain-containing protein n=1 Tax=Piscibacillus halophilus TaxID=571933 RepID=A0A1H9K7Z1_9BACI|nr:SurA N-terminal domain-containing protein [Piscibacillus halophilus]SEQ95168.1 SurA N-terminal domain-containing protein [Piscibacillus halophilus]
MKKFLTAILIVMLTAFLAACTGDSDESDNQEEPNEEEQGQEEENAEENEDENEEGSEESAAIEDIEDDQVVATVNETEILGEELKSSVNFFNQQYQQMGQDPSQLAGEIQKQALDNLIHIELVKQAAADEGIEVDEEEVDEEYQSQIQQVQEATDLESEEEVLEENETTEEEVKENIRQNLITTEYLEQNVEEPEVTDEELEEAYNNYKSAMEQQGQEVEDSLEDMEDQLREQVKSQKSGEKELELLEQLRENADVEVLI